MVGLSVISGPTYSVPVWLSLRARRPRSTWEAGLDRARGWLAVHGAVARRQLHRAETLVVIHPQTLGYRLVQEILEDRAFSWLYVVDSSFFCVRSHNYLDGERGPCLRCYRGNTQEAVRQGCIESVRHGIEARRFVEYLRSLALDRRVGFLATDDAQVESLSKASSRPIR